MGNLSEYYHRSGSGSAISERLYRSVLAVSAEPACIYDADGSLLLANDALTALVESANSARQPRDVPAPELRLVREFDGTVLALREALSDSGSDSDNLHVTRGYSLQLSGGTRVPVELREIRLGSGQLLCVLRNLTAEQDASRALAAEEKRRSGNKRLAGLGHDINNALTALRGAVELLHDDVSLSDEAHLQLTRMTEAISDAESAGAELAWLNNDSFAARRPGVWEVDELLRLAARSAVRGTAARCEITSTAPAAYSIVPSERFEQIVRALVENAAEAQHDGGIVRIRVSLLDRRLPQKVRAHVPVGEPGQMLLQIAIADSGNGIAEADEPHVFEPYFTSKPEAAGLGLTVARQTLIEFGGGMHLESSPGEGTVATAYVPVYGVGHRRVQGVHSGSDAKRIRVLIMDDNDLVRSTLRDILSRLGYRVTVTADGSEAVYMYEKALEAGAPFDVCILDSVVAGGLSGEEAMRRIVHRDSNACGVLLLAGAGDNHGYDGEQPGTGDELFRVTLYKPFGIQAVSDAIAHVLAERSS